MTNGAEPTCATRERRVIFKRVAGVLNTGTDGTAFTFLAFHTAVLMARIFIANFDSTETEQIAALLRRNGHTVLPLGPTAPDWKTSHAPLRDCDLLIIDVTKDDPFVHDLIGEVAEVRAQYGPRPMILCVTAADCGPRFEFDLERKGARVVYAR